MRNDGSQGYFDDNNFIIERKGFYGQCEKAKVLNFMED